MVKQATGKTITEHAIDSMNTDVLQQTYFPSENIEAKKVLIKPKISSR